MLRNSVDLSSVQTLVDLLRQRSNKHGGEPLFTFLADGETETAMWSFSDLDQRACQIAAALQLSTDPNDRALILMPSCLDFVAAFFGCLYAKVVAVPAYPPRANRNLERLLAIVNDCQAKTVLTTKQVLDLVTPWFEKTPELRKMRWIAVDQLQDVTADDWMEPRVVASDLAFLQYTSGSTGSPKGVMLTHANLIANLKMIKKSFKFDASSVMVSWLPMFHDMGLIGCVLEPVYAGCKAVIMPPTAFLERPKVWLTAVSKYQGSIAGGPNFAYELCVKKCKDEDLANMNLSSMTVLFNGAEPVRPQTLKKFAEKFAPCGFKEEALFPCYGLAEATLLVASGAVGSKANIIGFKKNALEEGAFIEVDLADEDAGSLTSCGQAAEQSKILILDPATGEARADGQVGEVWVNGPHIAKGYWQKEEVTKNCFGARPSGNYGANFLKTGDLGFIWRQNLYITGRLKDLVIIGGRNYYPQDLETLVEQCDPRIRMGGVACFGFEGDGKEHIGIVAEVERTAIKTNLAEAIEKINQALWEHSEVTAQLIALIKPGSIPKTSSGKIQRSACKREILNGSMETLHLWQGHAAAVAEVKQANQRAKASQMPPVTTPEVLAMSAIANEKTQEKPIQTSPVMTFTKVKTPEPVNESDLSNLGDALITWLAKNLDIAKSRIQANDSLPSLGIDSVVVVEMYQWIEEQFKIKVPPDLAWEAKNIGAMIERLAGLIHKAEAERIK